jgi:hypothetical protein
MNAGATTVASSKKRTDPTPLHVDRIARAKRE